MIIREKTLIRLSSEQSHAAQRKYELILPAPLGYIHTGTSQHPPNIIAQDFRLKPTERYHKRQIDDW